MSETVTPERAQEQTTAQVPEVAQLREVQRPEAPESAPQPTPRPRIPRPHCAC